MNTGIFSNYKLQREELLARIAQELELDETRKNKMETAYNSVYELLKKESDFFKNLEILIYPQGSAKIGTTVKPINGEDFDLDTVLHIYDPYYNHKPKTIYDALVKVLENDGYYKTIMEKKKRCVRLNYKSDFHIDILPACMKNLNDYEKIAIPEKALNNWSSGNPKGFANRFLNNANSVKKSVLKLFSDTLIKAKVESEPIPKEIYEKTPLQRAVQLVKRYRDIYYLDKDFRVSSIVITTIISESYNSEDSIYSTISNTITKIKDNYNISIASRTRFKIFNPVDGSEEFTDSWTDKHYSSFNSFINDFYKNWLLLENSFDVSGEKYIELFGEGIYKKSLQSQLKTFSSDSNNELIKSSSIIIGGNGRTDKKGKINEEKGVKNENYHSYGG